MKKILILTLALSLCISNVVSASFIDVQNGSLNQQSIEWMQEKGITPDGLQKFAPEKIITKGELYELAWRAAGYFPDSDISTGTGSRFASYVQKAVETGILKTEKDFLSGQKVSRGDGLKIIFDIMGIGVTRVYTKDEIPFSDIHTGSRYASIAKTASEFSIFSGENKFRPMAKMTRAEVADAIHKISTLTPQSTQTIRIIQVPQTTDNTPVNGFTSNQKFKILMDVWNKMHEKYVGKEPINDDKLLYGAIDGMVNKLDDRYTVFQEPVGAKSFSEALSGEFDGIGISIDSIDNVVKIVSPLQGTPASKAGLKANDTILQIDNRSVKGLSLTEVSNKIKGKTGTSVNLVIERDGKKMNFSIVREHIKLDAVVGEMRGNVAYIIVRNFTESSGSDFTKVAKKLLLKNPKSVIVDLRDNPGGYLDASLQMLDMFVPAKTRLASLKFSTRSNAEDFFNESNGTSGRVQLDSFQPEVIFYSIGNGELANLPVKVLINGGSASASEIMAASLKENQRATLIGEKSFGKGTVQEITDYTDGSLYKQTIGKWQTPQEHNLTENPIIPDVTIKDNPNTDGDEILNYALGN
ncbi:MAG: S41 family peptidase [Candidatus Gracilibacteria bacterium]|nr:S41 family peptidase [Candidatus Gracilibacteria bacterium]